MLALYLRKEFLSLPHANRIAFEAEGLLHGGEYYVSSYAVLQLVSQTNCSAYDCEFAALAIDLGLALLTIDNKLLTSFKSCAISLDDFIL